MTRLISLKFILLLLLVMGCASAPVLAQIGGGIFGGGGPKSPRVLTVCPVGCDARVLCNATCTTANDSTCVAGSAIERARAMSPSFTNPVWITVYGAVPECAAVNNITDLTIWYTPGSSQRPPATVATSIDGGALRIGNDATASGADRIHIIVDGVIHNDAFSSPEAAIQVGREACAAGSEATWGEVTITGNGRVIGHHDSIQWCGSRVNSDTATVLPRMTIDIPESIGGRDNIVKKGSSIDSVRVGKILTMTNYCESADETFLVEVSGAVQTGVGSPSILRIEAADDPNITNFYSGRKLTILANAGCPASGGSDHQAWVNTYDEVNQTLAFTPNAPGSTDDADCSYTIAAVPNFDLAPCRDKDWSAVFGSYWKVTGVHFGVNGATTAPALDSFSLDAGLIQVDVNDYGPNTATGCASQEHVAGILAYTTSGQFENVFIRAPRVLVNVPIDLVDTIGCANPIAGISVTGSTQIEDMFEVQNAAIRINNSGDADENVYGIVANSTGASAVRIGSAYIDINNTVAGYAGTTAHLLQGGSTSLAVGDIQADGAVTAVGTISGLRRGLSGSVTHDFANLIVADCADSANITVTGAAFGDMCSVSNAAAIPVESSLTCLVTAADTVVVRHCCSGVAACDPANMTYTVSIEKK